MTILIYFPFGGASAMHRGCTQTFVETQPAAAPRAHAGERFEMIGVTVASRYTLLARRAVLACPRTAVERCLPLPGRDKVKLEVRFPAGAGEAVIGRILARLPEAEVSGISACATARTPARRAHNKLLHAYGR